MLKRNAEEDFKAQEIPKFAFPKKEKKICLKKFTIVDRNSELHSWNARKQKKSTFIHVLTLLLYLYFRLSLYIVAIFNNKSNFDTQLS